MSMPHRVSWPEVGGKSPESRLVRVDLPAPFGPITAWIRSRQRSSETSLTAASPPKRLVNWCACSNTSFMANVLAPTPEPGQSKQAARCKYNHQHNEAADPELPMLAQINATHL